MRQSVRRRKLTEVFNRMLKRVVAEEINRIKEEDAMDDFDLENAYMNAPQEVKDLLDAVGDEQDYNVHKKLQQDLARLGYEYDYDLSGTATYLAPKKG